MAIVKVRKPPTKRPVGYETGAYPNWAKGAATGYAPKVSAGVPKAVASFRPVPYKPPRVTAPKYQTNIKAAGYRQGPNQMPVEYDPNADVGTMQGAINAGYVQWNAGLGKLGYKPPPRAPTEIGIPGTPGMGMDIGGDWEYQAALGDIAAANAADAAAAGENINALAVNWGGDLSNLVQAGLIDQQAADAAKVNQFSQMAGLQRSLQQGGGKLANVLASRGALNSGALVGGNAELDRQYQQESTTGLQSLMSQIRGIRSQQAQAAAERQGGLASVRSSVGARLAADPRYQPIPDMQAFWDNSVQAYVDDWGRRYNRQGVRVS